MYEQQRVLQTKSHQLWFTSRNILLFCLARAHQFT